MRIVNRLLSGTALLALPYFSTAQVTKATDDYAQMHVNAAPITIRVLDNDNVIIGHRLKVDYIPLVNHGTARITADSSAIEFTPDRDFKGIALVNYTIADGDGTFDCGLVVIDVAATPTPNSQEMNLFTRKGQPVRFTVPTGFVMAGMVQGATIQMVSGYVGVYQFTPNAMITGTFDVLFNKLENGVSKEFHVIVEVLTAPPVPTYLVDYYYSTQIGGYKDISLLDNIRTYPSAAIVDVTVIPSGNCTIIGDGTNTKNGKFTVTPDRGFKGSIRFDYKVTYANGYSEMATVHLTVSNFEPAASTFNIVALAHQTQVLPYKVPADFSQYKFDVPNTITTNGGTIQVINNELIYTAPSTTALTDAFSVKYCPDGGDCQVVDVKVTLINAPNGCTARDCVWAGDANQDGRVDMLDIFPIGDNMGQYGSKRTNNNNWSPQSVPNWRTLTPGVLDPKYADTNGDGMVTVSDTAAIMTYYGNSSTLYPEKTAEDSRIQTFLLSGMASVRPGDMIEILVLLGSSDYPAIDARGLSFSVDYSAQKVDESSVDVDFGRFNWLSRYDAFLTLDKIPQSGTVDAAIVRSRDRGASGHGQVGTIRAVVVDDVSGLHEGDKPSVRFTLKNVVLVDGQGHSIAVQGSEIVIPLEVKDNKPVSDKDVLLFPNPTSDFAEFYLNGVNTIQSIRILDMRGREMKNVKNVNGKQTRINLDDLTNGLYMAEVMTEKGRVVKKLQVIK